MPRIIGETPSQRNEREGVRDELNAKMDRTGNNEFIDIFTTVPDPRTTDEILARVPKCCIGHKPKPLKPMKLKPAPKYKKLKPMKMVNRRLVWEKSEQQSSSRAKQQHQEQI